MCSKWLQGKSRVKKLNLTLNLDTQVDGGTITCDSDDGMSGESLCCCDRVLVLEANGQETLSPLFLSLLASYDQLIMCPVFSILIYSYCVVDLNC